MACGPGLVARAVAWPESKIYCQTHRGVTEFYQPRTTSGFPRPDRSLVGRNRNSTMRPQLLLTGTIFFAALSQAEAQLPFRYSLDSPTNDTAFAVESAGLGDIDGDGYADFAVSETDTGPFQPPGVVYVHSGKSGQLLYTFQGISNADGYGLALDSAGDVNGDNVQDLLIGAREDETIDWGSGRVEVRSGADGSLLHELIGLNRLGHFGDSVAGAGDVNGDGYDDFWVSEQGTGTIFLYSGFDASHLQSLLKPLTAISWPDSIANAGDVDGDGKNDLVVGERSTTSGSLSNHGSLSLYSSSSGALLIQVMGDDYQEQLGKSVAGGVDLNHDGIPDFLGGAQGEINGNGDLVGAITLFSGADGSILMKDFGSVSNPVTFGRWVDFAGDLNGDGVEDFAGVAQTPGTVGASGYARFYSGADFQLLDEFQTASSTDFFGSCFSPLGDLNGDDLPDFLLGAKGSRQAHIMAVAGSLSYGVITEASQQLSLAWQPSGNPDASFGQLFSAGAPPHAPGTLYYSAGATSIDHGGLTQLVDLNASYANALGIVFDQAGEWRSKTISLRHAKLAGTSLFAQVIALDPSANLGRLSSPGIEGRFTQ
ncbi:MAG: hypothetical protein DWQ01_02180 [Planctomycetota bacterium]|nr:MAG: hypothetical protein DWQ01_02180 [Planctomycetota bacterium]